MSTILQAITKSAAWAWQGLAKNTPRTIRALLALLALGSIGYGVWLIHEPSSYITLGALLWLDMTFQAPRQAPRT